MKSPKKKKKRKQRTFRTQKISDLNQCQCQTMSGSSQWQSQIMPESDNIKK